MTEGSEQYSEPSVTSPIVIPKGAGRNRTGDWEFCRLLPYHLATAPKCLQSSAIDSVTQAIHPLRCAIAGTRSCVASHAAASSVASAGSM